MEMLLFALFCLLTILHSAVSYEEDYYWKDYKGTIPADAYPAGRDAVGKDTYIGQGYIHNFALSVGQIQPGKKEFDFPCYGVKKITKNIKIFCTRSPSKLSWVSTTASTFHVDMIGLHPVPGGTDEVDSKGELDIGRVMYQGILKIGAIAAYSVSNAFLFFPHNNKELSTTRYQVLVYNHSVPELDNAAPCIDWTT